MANIIQLHTLPLVNPQLKTYTQTKKLLPTGVQSAISNLQRCFINFYKPQIRYINQKEQILSIHFVVPFIQRMALIYDFQVNKSNQLRKIKVKLKKQDGLSFMSSNQMIRGFCKILTYMNFMLIKTRFIHMINLYNGQISCKVPIAHTPLHNNKILLIQIKNYLQQSLSFMTDMNALILYNSSPQSLKYVSQRASPFIEKMILGQKGQLNFYTQIKEYFPFLNSFIQTQSNQNLNKNKQNYPNLRHSKDLIEFCFKQQQKYENQNILFSFNNYNKLQHPILGEINIESLKGELFFPFQRDVLANQSSITQINIVSDQKQKQKILNQSSKAKVSLINLRFQVLSKPQRKIPQNKSNNQQKICLTHNKQQKEIVQRKLIIKQPSRRNDPSKKLYIKYEKQIIQQLCSSFCAYFPTYYQANSQNTTYKDQIIMDFILGPSLHQEIQIKKTFLSITSKLRILMHLTNALRFLENKEITHIDLSPNNILIIDDFMVKVIDFGQAYCDKVASKYLTQKSGKNNFKYKPWKTYLYSSPQAYSRSKNFSSKQDIYSLGMITFKMLFGHYILNCSQKNLQQMYKNKEYMDRMFFVPEKGYDLGNHQMFNIMSNLIFKMLSPDQKMRPTATWSHLMLRRILLAQRPLIN